MKGKSQYCCGSGKCERGRETVVVEIGEKNTLGMLHGLVSCVWTPEDTFVKLIWSQTKIYDEGGKYLCLVHILNFSKLIVPYLCPSLLGCDWCGGGWERENEASEGSKSLEKLRPPSATELLLSNNGDQILEGCVTNVFVVCRKDPVNKILSKPQSIEDLATNFANNTYTFQQVVQKKQMMEVK
ncbi:hypothetical protein CsSME_00028309 [Camellia sinensis var. sinensis]